MRKLLKRWYVWLGLLLLLGLTGSAALIYVNSSRITRANWDRIQEGMSEKEVEKILGQSARQEAQSAGKLTVKVVIWDEGEDQIHVDFMNGEAVGKRMYFVRAFGKQSEDTPRRARRRSASSGTEQAAPPGGRISA
jgi:hypothetical protein